MTLDNWVNTAVAVSTILMICKTCLDWMYAEVGKRKYMMITGGVIALVCIKDIIKDFTVVNCFLQIFLSMAAMMLLLHLWTKYLEDATKEDIKAYIGIALFVLAFYVSVCLFA